MKYTLLLCFCILLSIASCKNDKSLKQKVDNTSIEVNEEKSIHPSFVTDIEFAHEKSNIATHEMISFNLEMNFGSTRSLIKIYTTPNSSNIRVDKSDGTSTILYNGKTYTNADSSKWDREKFGLYTYHYFFMTPYKLSDPGTKWEQLSPMDINEEKTNRALLTFDNGTGDSPNDWYMVHTDPTSNLIKHVGYIVTGGGTSVEEAEKNAHAITYSEFVQVIDMPIATKWTFNNYDRETGLGDQVGEGSVRNIDFDKSNDIFSIALTEKYKLIR